MATRKPKIAIILDFDETLTDDSTTALLDKNGIDADQFWDVQVKKLVDNGFDPTEAYLMQLVKELKRRGRLDQLRDHNLRKFGATLDFHDGVLELRDELRRVVNGRFNIQLFVISGGLQEIIAGSGIKNDLTDFWGCTYHWDRQLGVPYPKSVLSFTEKTKHVFQINKGLIGSRYKNKPFAVNEYMSSRVRKIPFKNMIYIGDGFTDVPCFSLISRKGGHAVCVYNHTKGRRKGLQRAAAKKLTRKALAVSFKAITKRDVGGPFRAVYVPQTALGDYIADACRNYADGSSRIL